MEAQLVLADGTVLRGKSFGARGTAIGEVVFNTGMTGYQEVLTDPSYAGQLVTFTYPEFGNTGINEFDMESDKPAVQAVISRELSPVASSWRATASLDQWLQQHGVVGLFGVDTRALVRVLREGGAMNGAVSSDGTSAKTLHEMVCSAPSMEGLNLAQQVSTPKPYSWQQLSPVGFDQRLKAQPSKPYQVVAIDFGIKRAILERLAAHGCELRVLPASCSLEQVLACKPEGVFLSNGPGDPAAVSSAIGLARGLLQEKTCLFLAFAWGIKFLVWPLVAEASNLVMAIAALTTPVAQRGLWKLQVKTMDLPLMRQALILNG